MHDDRYLSSYTAGMTSTRTSTGSQRFVAGPVSSLPTKHGTFAIRSFTVAAVTHTVLTIGEPAECARPLVRVHSECLTGDALGSFRCDCGDQLDAALAEIAAEGHGILVYMSGHEGRGIGLAAKLQAYALQDDGMDTVAANRALGLPDDARDYTAAAEILRELGCSRIRLLTSNPSKQLALEELGIDVADRVRLPVPERPENSAYISSKRQRMNHDAPPESDAGQSPVNLSGFGEDIYASLAANQEVVAQLAQSQDGFIATRTGDACFVSGTTDRTHLHRIRAHVGTVLVGAQTVIADDPQLTVRAVPGTDPVRVVLDPHARVPVTSTVLSTGPTPTLWLIGAEAAPSSHVGGHVRVIRLPSSASPQDIIAVVRGQVAGSVLVEGGGRTVSSFLAAGALDRLFLTTAPVFIGDGVPGIRFQGSEVMAQALRTPFRRFELGEDMCTEYLLSQAAVAHSQPSPGVQEPASVESPQSTQ